MKKLVLLSLIGIFSIQSFAQNLRTFTVKDYLTVGANSYLIKNLLESDYGEKIANEFYPVSNMLDELRRTYKYYNDRGECSYQGKNTLPKIHSKADEEQYEKDKQEWIAKCKEVSVIWDKKLLTLYKERLEKIVSSLKDEDYWLGFNVLDKNEREQFELAIKDLIEDGY